MEESERSLPKNRIARRLGGLLWVKQVRWPKIGIFAVSITLFVLALELMKAGARGLAPLTNDLLHVEYPVSGLGFGWLTSYLVLSGSPVAAMALTFLDVGSIGPHTAFAMIVGSRVGASTVVVLIGLHVDPGAVFGLLGQNSAGRTTTIRFLTGLA